jgi:FO synthase
MHIHAFSPLEVVHGAATLELSLSAYLERLMAAGLRSLPGTAAEILDDPVRRRLAADKISTAQWFEVMDRAHEQGLRSTATIMFGHLEGQHHWAQHVLLLKDHQARTRGFTEFVPLPFVHDRAPFWVKGRTRSGPTWREVLVMHAMARLILGETFRNVQTSWTKLGRDGASACLQAGANDLGGTLMDESITRAAGGINGQEMTVSALASIAAEAGRPTLLRKTIY